VLVVAGVGEGRGGRRGGRGEGCTKSICAVSTNNVFRVVVGGWRWVTCTDLRVRVDICSSCLPEERW
jgi:hypothetical protein